MRNGDNGVTFECEDPILFHTERVNMLSDLKSLILSRLGGTEARGIGRMAYKLLAPMVDEAKECEEESNEDYVADSGDSYLSDSGDDNECVLETPVPTAGCHVLPPPLPIPALSAISSHYHSLDLDAMYERTPFLDTGEEDYNLDDGVEFRVSHKFRSREAVLQGIKNYSI
ncbi:uncharacterized protein DS421_3g89730 [Arachis hypogaea]|nr:uncharacterized protein DS421_3g89730 [Arachis hypogaea]